MTQDEQQLLNGLIQRVNSTQLASKDDEAERLLQGAFGTNPDALYILCQTVLVQQFAMDNTQRQLIDARAEIDRLNTAKPQEHGSFLGNLFGLGKSDNYVQQPQAQSAPLANQVAPANLPTGYTPVHDPGVPQYGYPPPPPQMQPGYGQPAYGQQGYGGGMPMGGGMFGGGGGFLQGAMQTAAGVVAGQFAFRALEDVFQGFGGGGGRGFGGGSEVVNNYYGNDAGSGDSGGFGDRLRDADGLGNGISPDIEDRRGDSHGFFGSADDGGGNGSDFAGTNGDDDNSFSDDGGGFDGGDSGNDDSGF